MPELPEVETVKRILEQEVVGKVIQRVEIYREKNIITNLEDFKNKLVNQTIIRMERKGKYILFHLSSSLVLLSHLRMEGKYFLKKAEEDVAKHDILSFLFSDGSKLVYNDVRKFGVLGLYKEDDYLQLSPLSHLGKEPWELSKEELYSSLRPNECIKSLIMDQSLIAGLGNIYADETLFASHLDPRTPGRLIAEKDCSNILENSKRIMEEAILEGGSTIKSYHPKEGMNGLMQNHLEVYGKSNTPCPRCSFLLHRIFLNGRSATYCPICQRNRERPILIGVSGPIHSGKSSLCSIFSKHGLPLLSCDEIVAKLYQKKEVISLLKKHFGKGVILDGKINKKALSEAIKSAPKKNKKLTDLIHPLVKEEILNELKNYPLDQKVVIEIPLLVHSGLEDILDMVILVSAKIENQQKRIEKEGRDAKTLLKINSNYPYRTAKSLASIEIKNDGSFAELESKVDELALY